MLRPSGGAGVGIGLLGVRCKKANTTTGSARWPDGGGCPGWPPILFFLPRRGRSLDGATMSLEGGLEEFDEFFLRRAIELLMALLGQSVSLSYLEYLRDQAR